jgi:FG-GAP-like repeat
MTSPNPTIRRWLWSAPMIILAVAATVLGCRRAAEDRSTKSASLSTASPIAAADIEKDIRVFCGSACHAYPPADTFPRRHWRAEVERGFGFFEKSGRPMHAPPIEAVVRYYEEHAPDELPPAKLQPEPHPLSVKFDPVSYPPPAQGGKPGISHLSLVRLTHPKDTTGPFDILACDMQGGRIMLLSPADPAPAWKVLGEVKNPAHATVADLDGDGILDLVIADLGSYPPTDGRCGSVAWLRGQADGTFAPPVILLDNVGRVADVQAADFRGTGRLDLIVGVFGLHVAGEVILLENETTDWNKPRFVSKRIDSRHGAIHVPVADLNGDGKPDFVCLFAQEHEAVVAFINDGKGGFKSQTLYAGPHPAYGSSGIELVDLNGDGKLDVLYSNGDILDEPYLLKPYHSIQWLENKGDLKFEHHPISPMYGVHRAVAADVLGTGRKAVVAVSFLPHVKFPDRVTRKADALTIFEQTASGQFERHPIASIDCDAVVCVAGDLYGTGRQDIVVGNFSSPKTDHPVTIWRNMGPKK